MATPAGTFRASFSDRGLAELRFPSNEPDLEPKEHSIPEPVSGWVKVTRDAIVAILAGKVPEAFPPLDLQSGTEFQRRVWAALQAIPLHKTMTYSEIAAAIGAPGAARAVGNACGANPIPLIIPCHRVVAGGGKLGGFSGGLDWKKRLLAAEGALPVDGRERSVRSNQELLPFAVE